MTQATPKEFDTIIRNDLYAFLRMVFRTLAPSTSFESNWHIELLCLYARTRR